MSEFVGNVDQLHDDEGFWDRFRSRPRVLARWFHESREKWKRKYQELKRELKRLQVQVADVRDSREKWKEEALQKGTELAQMKAKIERLQRQLEESKIEILPPTLSQTSRPRPPASADSCRRPRGRRRIRLASSQLTMTGCLDTITACV